MNRIVVLQLEVTLGSLCDTVYPVILQDAQHCVLVDCGFAGSLAQLEKCLCDYGIVPGEVTHMILTHHDHDHVGAAAAFQRKYPNVLTMSSAIEQVYISGKQKSLRLAQAEQLQKSLPADQQASGEAFCNYLKGIEPVRIDQIITPGETLEFCGGCEVINTSGHTPGHISLYVPSFETIVSGDAMVIEDGEPKVANPQYALSLEDAIVSMEKLLSYHAKKIVCYHGGVLTSK